MKKLPKVVIVGFPNVGKSTLFNRLLGRRKSLVHSLPGMTRDWVSDVCRIQDREFLLVDTGGFFDTEEDPFSAQVKAKAWEASQDADLLLFVLDGKRDLLPVEEELYIILKKLDTRMFVVVNKVDTSGEEERLSEYHRLGEASVYPISAEHKRNLEELESALAADLPERQPKREEVRPLRIAIVGRINVGKSSIINRFCGHEKLIVSELPGTTRDSTDTIIYREQKAFALVDTAGIRKLSRTRDKREKAGIIKAKKNISQADVVCLVMDAQEFPTRQDTAIAHLANESGKPMMLALNKWDLVPEEEQSPQAFRRRAYLKLEFVSFAPLIFISALTGKRVVRILDLAESVYASGSRKISTSKLNDFLTSVNRQHPPRARGGKEVKLKYMTQAGILPPTFILFTQARAVLAPAYKKYFIHLLHERFDFEGTPLRLIMKSS